MSTLQCQTRRGAAVALVWIAFALPVAARAQPAAAEPSPQPAIDPQVAAVVKAMSDRVAQAKAFSFRAVMVREELGDNGQILDAVTDYRFEIERPNRMRAAVRTEQADLELFYDGKQVTLFDPARKLYATTPAPATLDATIGLLNDRFGAPLPATPLLLADPYPVISDGWTEASEVGVVKLSGTDYYHMAFREPEVDWQLWVGGADPLLPRRLAVVYKAIEQAPRVTVDFSDWNLAASPAADRFTFKPPIGAARIDWVADSD